MLLFFPLLKISFKYNNSILSYFLHSFIPFSISFFTKNFKSFDFISLESSNKFLLKSGRKSLRETTIIFFILEFSK